MLKKNSATIFLAAAVMFAPMLLSSPANAESRYENWRGYTDRPVYSEVGYQRVVRLRNGAYRLPNGRIIPPNRLVRLRNRGYWRLPNGDIVLPSQEIVPSRRLVRQRDGRVRLPNGVFIRL